MGKHNNSIHSSDAPTLQVDNTDRNHQHRQHNQTKNSQNPTLILGPITREKRSKLQCKKSSKALCNRTTPSKKKTRRTHTQHLKIMAQKPETAPEATKSLATTRLLISIETILMAILLIRLLPFKFIVPIFQELWNDRDKLSMSHEVVASPTGIESLNNSMVHAMVKYTKMAAYPFLLFVPSLVMLSLAIVSATMDDAENVGRNTILERRNGRKRVLKLMSISTSGLFIFLSVMIACADTSRWIMLGVISVVTPAILMLLARLSVVYSDASSGYAEESKGMCTNGLSWCSIAVDGSQYYASKAATLLGFVFVFLPFLAGFFYMVSPPYLLAVPLTYLTTCTITGIFGVIPLVISMICIISLSWMLTKLFRIYFWFVNRNFSMLLFLVCIAMLMTTLGVQVPSYL